MGPAWVILPVLPVGLALAVVCPGSEAAVAVERFLSPALSADSPLRSVVPRRQSTELPFPLLFPHPGPLVAARVARPDFAVR